MIVQRDKQDLNKVPDDVLGYAKAAMEIEFMRNKKSHDDPAFNYDVRVRLM